MRHSIEEFYNYIKGKTVAIVCPAEYMVGLGKGKEIDLQDIVVRVKYIPDNVVDYGGRNDVFYHHFNTKRVDVLKLLRQYKRAKPEWVIHKLERRIKNTLPNIDYFKWACVEEVGHVPLREATGRQVNTGVLAIYTILQAEPKEVRLYGMDFYRSGYGKTKNRIDISIKKAKKAHKKHHNADSQIMFMKRLVEEYDNFIIDDTLRQVLDEWQCKSEGG